jgi:hypothetical protein
MDDSTAMRSLNKHFGALHLSLFIIDTLHPRNYSQLLSHESCLTVFASLDDCRRDEAPEDSRAPPSPILFRMP